MIRTGPEWIRLVQIGEKKMQKKKKKKMKKKTSVSSVAQKMRTFEILVALLN